jgi:hypothetical protein
MDAVELKRFIIDNSVRDRTVQSFWKCFENYRNEEPKEFEEVFGDFDRSLLTMWMKKVALTIRNWQAFEDEYNENHEFVEAFIQLKYKGKYIGYYSLLFNFDGAVFDDFFVLE